MRRELPLVVASRPLRACLAPPKASPTRQKDETRVRGARERRNTVFCAALASMFSLSPRYLHQVTHHQVPGMDYPAGTLLVQVGCSTLDRTTYGSTTRTGRSGLLRNKAPPLHLQRHHYIILGVHAKETPTENRSN